MISLLRRRSPIGLDIGGHSVKAVQSIRTRSGWQTAASACFPRKSSNAPLAAPEVADIAAVLGRQGFVGSDVVITAACDKVLTGTLELPARGRDVPMEQIARAEFARIHKCDVGASEFCWWELPTPARAGKATQVMAVAFPHAHAEQQLAPFDQAGLRVKAIDTPASALARTCRELAGNLATVAAVDLGWRGTTIVVIRHGVVAYERRIATDGLSKLHASLAARFGIEDNSVEQLIEEFGVADGEGDSAVPAIATDARALLTAHLSVIVEDVLKTCSYAQRQDPDAPIQLLFLAGGGACIPGIVDHFQSVLGLEVRAAQPSPALHAQPNDPQRTTPSHAAAAGLARFLN
jgi:Tfp pilus assembly PilM family ATPase